MRKERTIFRKFQLLMVVSGISRAVGVINSTTGEFCLTAPIQMVRMVVSVEFRLV